MPQLTDMLKRVSIGGSKNNLAAAIISASPIRGKSNGNAASANSSPMRRKISLPLEGLDEEAVAAFTCPGTNCIKVGLPGKLILSKGKGLRGVLFSLK